MFFGFRIDLSTPHFFKRSACKIINMMKLKKVMNAREIINVLYEYNGLVLKIDLADGNISTEKPPESFYRTYFEGRALIAYCLLHACMKIQ